VCSFRETLLWMWGTGTWSSWVAFEILQRTVNSWRTEILCLWSWVEGPFGQLFFVLFFFFEIDLNIFEEKYLLCCHYEEIGYIDIGLSVCVCVCVCIHCTCLVSALPLSCTPHPGLSVSKCFLLNVSLNDSSFNL
jgi:hypothetical protein